MQGEKNQPNPAQQDNGVGNLGMAIFLVSLGVLFIASLVGYFVVRLRAEEWPPPDMPSMPVGLWFSTLLILISSVTIQVALSAINQSRISLLKSMLVLTSLLGIGFLISQGMSWRELYAAQVPPSVNLYAYTFYTLTGLHGVHVVGGLVLLGVVTYLAYQGRYTASYHPGVRYSVMYWHFLDVVWLVLFLSLVVFG